MSWQFSARRPRCAETHSKCFSFLGPRWRSRAAHCTSTSSSSVRRAGDYRRRVSPRRDGVVRTRTRARNHTPVRWFSRRETRVLCIRSFRRTRRRRTRLSSTPTTGLLFLFLFFFGFRYLRQTSGENSKSRAALKTHRVCAIVSFETSTRILRCEIHWPSVHNLKCHCASVRFTCVPIVAVIFAFRYWSAVKNIVS